MIWGVDLGVRKAHFFGASSTPILFSIDLAKLQSRDLELKGMSFDIKNFFSNLLPEENGDIFFIEEPVLAGTRNIRIMMQIAQVSGVVASSIISPAYFVPVSSWKKATVGKGNAKKEDIRHWLFTKFPLYSAACERTDSPQDYADAACVAIYGSKMLGLHI